MTLLLATLLSVTPTSMTARQGKSLDGGYTAWAVECVAGCSGGGGAAESVEVTGQVGVNVIDSGVLNVQGAFYQATQPVSAASLPLPSGAATSAKQDTGNTSLSSIDSKTPALVSGRQPVDGSGVTQPVSGTFWQATQPVSGTVTANAGSGTFTVSGTVTANAGSGTLAVSGPVTDAQLRASAVPVSLATAPTTPITAAALPLPSGAATDSTLSALLDGGTVQLGRTPDGTARAIAVTESGVQYVTQIPSPIGARPGNALSLPCNAVRRTNCR